MKIRRGTKEDIPVIVAMGDKFYEESNFEEGGFDPVRFAQTLGYACACDTHHVLVAENDDEIIGFIIFDISRHYTKYPVSCMFLLYVDKDKRVHNAGKLLVSEAVRFATNKGCKYFYGSSSAGFDDDGRTDRGLRAIYKRQGFEDNGFFMRKVLQ